MKNSTYVWVKPTAVEQLRSVYGFKVTDARGEGRYFIESTDSILDPTAELHRIPADAITGVTVRNKQMKVEIDPGLYIEAPGEEMLVRKVTENKLVQQGMFQVAKDVEITGVRWVRIKTPSRQAAVNIVNLAIKGELKPKPEVSGELMAALV